MAVKNTSSEGMRVDLEAFRKKNALKQQDIADFLGTSRGYISMVENGDRKLSAANLDKLFEGAIANNWDVSDLVPDYSRLQSVLSYLLEKEVNGLTKVSGDNFFSEAFKQKLKHGEIGFNETVSDQLLKYFPEISRQWLLDGSGEMLLAPNQEPSELDKLREEVRLLRVSLNAYQEENRRLLESLPKLIAAEMAKRSEQSVSKKK